MTAVLIGVSSERQSGSSRSSPTGSITAPDRIWAPTSEPFSTTTTVMSATDLLEADGGGEAGGAGADNNDIEFHRLAGGQLGHRSLPARNFPLLHTVGNRAPVVLDWP